LAVEPYDDDARTNVLKGLHNFIRNAMFLALQVQLSFCIVQPTYLKSKSYRYGLHTAKPYLKFTCRLGGVMVSVLAVGPKVRDFKPGRGDGFLWAIEIIRTPFFGEEVKRSAPCKILQHVNIIRKYEQRYFEGQIHHFKFLLICN
jgi:hypothetical protein